MCSPSQERRKIYQPLHPLTRSRLDPQYAAIHDFHLQYIPPSESIPWGPDSRSLPGMPSHFSSAPIPVGSTRDINLGLFKVRAFTPTGEKPEVGWPVLLWFHGGGCVLGDIGSENNFLTMLCERARCVVVTVDYRLAPENPFPAAVDDAVAALEWVVKSGDEELGIDTTKIAVGGSSSGGNLATVLSLLASTLTPAISLTFLLLTIPVIDQTATSETSWSSNANAPWLTPARMTWYRDMYLTNPEDSKKWTASPNLAPKDVLAKSPPVWMGVSECDILCAEGMAYAELLRELSVDVECVVYPGSTHSILALDG
ncbi:hypothetical protein IFR04_005227 [Cadophora malorum]|uniref:Alpha/beta hydrolase fold-3 domain-containing protein n=1 Tax=Cadophora malorum TaxID=108018 RepID=A0A8H7TMH4_9HELO|nr:hypothetical protein IFR04_005227 [Cadophora malorum]